jgi:hypothetical protein
LHGPFVVEQPVRGEMQNRVVSKAVGHLFQPLFAGFGTEQCDRVWEQAADRFDLARRPGERSKPFAFRAPNERLPVAQRADDLGGRARAQLDAERSGPDREEGLPFAPDAHRNGALPFLRLGRAGLAHLTGKVRTRCEFRPRVAQQDVAWAEPAAGRIAAGDDLYEKEAMIRRLDGRPAARRRRCKVRIAKREQLQRGRLPSLGLSFLLALLQPGQNIVPEGA